MKENANSTPALPGNDVSKPIMDGAMGVPFTQINVNIPSSAAGNANSGKAAMEEFQGFSGGIGRG